MGQAAGCPKESCQVCAQGDKEDADPYSVKADSSDTLGAGEVGRLRSRSVRSDGEGEAARTRSFKSTRSDSSARSAKDYRSGGSAKDYRSGEQSDKYRSGSKQSDTSQQADWGESSGEEDKSGFISTPPTPEERRNSKDDGNGLKTFATILKGVRKLKDFVGQDHGPSPVELARGIYIKKVYDFYDPSSRSFRLRKMQDDVFHARGSLIGLNYPRPETVQERQMNSDRGSDSGSDIGSEKGSESVGSAKGSESVGSAKGSESVGSDSVRADAADRGSPNREGERGGRGGPAPAKTEEPQPTKGQKPKKDARRFITETNYDVVTRWGVFVGRVLSSTACMATIFETAQVKKRLGQVAADKKSIVPPSVRDRAHKVLNQARRLAKMIPKEKDIVHELWEDKDPLTYLFGKDPEDCLLILTKAAIKILRSSPTVSDVKVPCRIFGDTHGQLRDLLYMWECFGHPGANSPTFIFNGDFVDRGRHQIEVAGLMIALKVAMPDKIVLIRGNHEDECMNRDYGFYYSCQEFLKKSFATKVFDIFQQVFDLLPLACLIEKRVLVLHGGIGTGTWKVDNLRNVKRPLTSADVNKANNNWLYNIMWSDPIEDDNETMGNCYGVHPSPRSNKAIQFSWNVTETFCARNGLSLVVRSHQVQEGGRGFSIMHNNQLLRIFSARDYEGNGNDAATLLLTRQDEKDPTSLLVVKAQVIQCVTKQEGVFLGNRPRRRSLPELAKDLPVALKEFNVGTYSQAPKEEVAVKPAPPTAAQMKRRKSLPGPNANGFRGSFRGI